MGYKSAPNGKQVEMPAILVPPLASNRLAFADWNNLESAVPERPKVTVVNSDRYSKDSVDFRRKCERTNLLSTKTNNKLSIK